jgi:hypothetical protein
MCIMGRLTIICEQQQQTLRWISTRNLFRNIRSFHSFVHSLVCSIWNRTSHAREIFNFKLPSPLCSPVSPVVPSFYGFIMISFDREITKAQQQVKNSLWYSWTKELLGLSEIGVFQTIPYLSPHPKPPPQLPSPPHIFSFSNKNYNIRWVMVLVECLRNCNSFCSIRCLELINLPQQNP